MQDLSMVYDLVAAFGICAQGDIQHALAVQDLCFLRAGRNAGCLVEMNYPYVCLLHPFSKYMYVGGVCRDVFFYNHFCDDC